MSTRRSGHAVLEKTASLCVCQCQAEKEMTGRTCDGLRHVFIPSAPIDDSTPVKCDEDRSFRAVHSHVDFMTGGGVVIAVRSHFAEKGLARGM